MRTKAPDTVPVFGRRLRALRRARHLTQQELADAIGSSRETISYLEARAANPTLEMVRTFADFFEVSADALIYDEAEPRRPGQISRLEQQLEKLRQLPMAQQKTVVSMLDGLLQAAGSGK